MPDPSRDRRAAPERDPFASPIEGIRELRDRFQKKLARHAEQLAEQQEAERQAQEALAAARRQAEQERRQQVVAEELALEADYLRRQQEKLRQDILDAGLDPALLGLGSLSVADAPPESGQRVYRLDED